MRIILFILLVILLTITTQIGGIILVVAWGFCRLFIKQFRLIATSIIFILLYCIMSFVAVPVIAPYFGRVTLSCDAPEYAYKAASPLYCWTNRNYVSFETKKMLEQLSIYMNKQFLDTQTLYLDANFPFINGFPLIPHLSHKDGEKIDIAFYYLNASGQYEPGLMRSPIGYFAFEPMTSDTLPLCDETKWLTLRWNFKWLQPLFNMAYLDDNRTKAAINWLSTTGLNYGVNKVFIEPHLKERMRLTSDIMRFQGCRAARHDDHIHIETH